MSDRLMACCAAIAVGAVCGLLVAGSGARAASARRSLNEQVLVIGDSIATGMYWHDSAILILQKNLAISWQVAMCRTTTGPSCPALGQRPENAIDLVTAMSEVPSYVVIELGYNDEAATFAASVTAFVNVLLQRGARHIFWLTLREARDPYPAMNASLRAAAGAFPQLHLLDWNAFSAAHPDWFQSDGLHLLVQGGNAMAHFIHGAVIAAIAPLTAAPTNLTVCRSRPLRHYLTSRGGTSPFTWRVAAGRPPRGLHLRSNGLLYGTRLHSSRPFTVRVTDADGSTASARVHVTAAMCA